MKFIIEIDNALDVYKIIDALQTKAEETGDENTSDMLKDVANQLRSIKSSDLGPKHGVCRHAVKSGAELVAKAMRPLTNAEITVEHSPVDEQNRKRGVGDWNIMFQHGNEHGSCWASHRMASCESMATKLVLADALRRYEPNHSLLQTWYLKEENRSNLAKYYA